MKKLNFALAIVTIMTGLMLTSCKPNTEKVQDAQENVDSTKTALTKAEDNLNQAKRAATTEEWQQFKEDTNAKIEENNAKIAELKLKIKNAGKDIDKAYQRNIDTIEQKNKDLKIKIDSYKNDVNSDWNSFKRELNHDVDELGKSLKDFTVDNKK
ncbi:hypothetical protein [Flavobacterium sp. 5]|uniref:hypothetical protein n=1 Tax=Flavobacterium sp. 5 TaxID=2035199 RepID=UPI0012FDC4A0|nr:hypothetical protein [Flavobacterium sp. 5]